MKKVGIINCYEVSTRCSGSGCFKAFNNKTGAFEEYQGEEIELVSFVHCNGCNEASVEEVLTKAKKMKAVGVEYIHLSSCVKAKCPLYDNFMKELSKEHNVVGYTHSKKKTGI